MMKKINLIAAIFAVLVFGAAGTSFAATFKTALTAAVGSNSEITQRGEKSIFSRWRIQINCCPWTIIISRDRFLVSGNLTIDEKSGTLLVSQLKNSDAKMRALDLEENFELSAEEAKQMGYERVTIPAGSYEIKDGKEIRLSFQGEKTKSPTSANSTRCNASEVATLKSAGKTSEVVFDETALKTEYEYYVAEQRKISAKKIQSLDEFREVLKKDILELTRAIIPNGQPQNFTIHIQRWTDSDGHRHTRVTFTNP